MDIQGFVLQTMGKNYRSANWRFLRLVNCAYPWNNLSDLTFTMLNCASNVYIINNYENSHFIRVIFHICISCLIGTYGY